MNGATDAALEGVLETGRRLGYLGPASIESHLDNARCFVEAMQREPCLRLVDLGSGGGVPALVIAVQLPLLEVALVERGARRVEFLEAACNDLELAGRVEVLALDAVVAARDAHWAGWADVVTARSFGAPAVTAECAVRYLRGGGRLIVSEPPNSSGSTRWPAAGCAQLGLRAAHTVECSATTLQVLHRQGPLHDRYPRRVAAILKGPVF